MVSALHSVCQKGFYIAIISTNVETNNPENEIKPALELIGSVKEKFITVILIYFNNNRYLTVGFLTHKMIRILAYLFQVQ